MGSRGMPILRTIGLELEFADIPRAVMRNVSAATNWRLVGDGSCRAYHSTRQGLPIYIGSQAGENVEFGGEFVSPLLTLEDDQWINQVAHILGAIRDAGEGISLRTSAHIHVNATGIPLYALKNLLRIARYLEDAYYRLSCGEAGVHRGALHLDYGFCRPLTQDGPPVTGCASGGDRPAFSPDALLNASSSNAFRAALGRYDMWDGNKYHEARYTWLNFIALYQHGSIEFRPFNMTHNHRYIQAWVDLCVNTVQMAFGKPANDLPTNHLGTGKVTLPDVVEFLMLADNRTIYTLEELWNHASYQRGVIGYQKGHLGQRINWRGIDAKLKPERVNTRVHDFYAWKSDLTHLQTGAIRLAMGD